MGKKKHKKKDMYDISVEDQLAIEKEMAKYFDVNYNGDELNEARHLEELTDKIDAYETTVDVSNENVNPISDIVSVDDGCKSSNEEHHVMSGENLLNKIINGDTDDDDDEISSIFDPSWDKRKRHKASNINSIIKGKKKRKPSDLLTDMILNNDDSTEYDDGYKVTSTASIGDTPHIIDMSEYPLPEHVTSGYIQPYEEKEEHEEEYPSSRFIFNEEENSILVFNDFIDKDNLKPDIVMSLNHLMSSRINMDGSYQYEGIVQDTVELMTLLRKPDFVLNHKGYEKFLSNFTSIDSDLVYIYKMSTCMTTLDTDPSFDKYLVYVYNPVSNISDVNEVLDLYNIVSNIGYKLPSFVQYLSQYLCNPLVSNINDWNHNNNLQLLTLGDHDEEEDCNELIDILTSPEISKLYEYNELWTEDSEEKPLNPDSARKLIKFDIQYLDIRIKRIQKNVNELLGIKEEKTYVDTECEKTDCENESFEDVDSDDLVIEKIITGENRKEE